MPPDQKFPKPVAWRRRPALASLTTGEDKYPHMPMVFGSMGNRFDGLKIEKIVSNSETNQKILK